MSIVPLPVFEADANPANRDALTDQELYDRLEPPKTIVVKYSYMKRVGEFPNAQDIRPGCGSKLVARTPRGTEIVEMLTTTCANAGCSKSVTRQEMLEYIENSGGSDYPFTDEGRILRVATIEDLNRQSELVSQTPGLISTARGIIDELSLDMKLVEVEQILGGELITLYYMAEERVDFRDLVRKLAGAFRSRIEMRQVGARDEARLVADYERCGQHCCCKNFLKVLKPVSMRSAKVQKATLDPLKISGRCGRLMCCLRYEDATYKELKSKLPPMRSRVGTPEGPGIVVETRILVQLVRVLLEPDDRELAVPVEDLTDPETCPQPGTKEWEMARRTPADPFRGMEEEEVIERIEETTKPQQKRRRRGGKGRRKTTTKHQQQDQFRAKSQAGEGGEAKPQAAAAGKTVDGGKKKRTRRGRGGRRRKRGGQGPSAGPTGSA